ncbi:ABC transporter ATP-binding protein [Paraburkholderia sp. 32]|uniref:ABC transporter ATP-binding protein n=1 Tax=Paraburkholderia sp. 32 TaxID=2991057 RepID=UPI003D1B566E
MTVATVDHTVNGAAPGIDDRRPPALNFRRVTRYFEGPDGSEVVALQDVNLAVRVGEFVAIVGPSGCGKSTLLSMAAGLDAPTAGEVSVDGTPLTGPRRHVANVFQNDHLLPWRTIIDNVLLPIELKGRIENKHREKAAELLRQVGLERFQNSYPHQLSGGMRQRASITRALIQDPNLLLMDEPFGALDALTREQMISDLQALWLKRGNSVLFITHGIEEAIFLADRVIVMSPRPGRIVQTLEITLPRPRTWAGLHNDPLFQEFMQIIRTSFEESRSAG